jgi:GxxExxY protein
VWVSEAVFQECLEMEFEPQRIRFIAHPNVAMAYKGRPLRQTYTPDFICEDKVILEIKSVSKLCDEHRAQVHSYLRASGHRLGLLVNFGHHPKVEYERIAM